MINQKRLISYSALLPLFLILYLHFVKYFLLNNKWIRGFGLAICLLIAFCYPGYAQYSNSWINFNQPYFKVSVSKDAIYRLTYTDLLSANFPVNSIDPRLIKLYHRGVEQAIFVEGETDAVFNTGDYIEFFGQKNDGTLDRKLYKPASLQPHSYFNLYSDTTAYFLTFSFIPPGGKRMASFSEVNVTSIPKEASHSEQRLQLLTNDYSGGNTQNSVSQNTYFDQGEGWTGTGIQQSQSIDYVVDLISNSVSASGLPQLEILLTGRDNISHVGQILVGQNLGSLRVINDFTFFGFETPIVSAPLSWSDIGADGKMTVRVTASAAATNRFQVSTSYIKISFPQNYNAAGLAEKVFRTSPNPTNKSYIEINNPAPGFKIWDVTDPDNVLTIGTKVINSSLSAVIPNTSSSRKLFTTSSYLTPLIKSLSFRQINATVPNFIIITNKALTKPALGYSNAVQAYAAYRASVQGGKYDTLVVTVDQLFDQFNYGETSSLAIYEFMRYLVANGNPKYLFIIGKGRDIYSYSTYQRKSFLTGEFRDLVPSAGLPASDAAFTAGLGGTTFDPKVPTGRLPASTPAQVAAYLNKIKETESGTISDPWKKQALHLSGGIQPYELPLFRRYVDGFKSTAQSDYWGASVATIGKRESNPVELINVSDQVNKGVNMITFFGHSSPGTIDIDIGFVSDPVLGYNNPGKYPVFLINGCNAGAFFLNGTLFGEDWMLAAGKGARNFIAHSSFGFSNTLQAYSDLFYKVGFGDSTFIQKGIGDVQKEVAKRYLTSFGSGISVVTQIQQMVLLGDPAVKLFGTSKPDFSIDNSSVSLVSLDGAPVSTASSSFGLKIIIKNLGATTSKKFPVRIVRTFSDNSSKTYDSIFSSVRYQDTLIFKISKDTKGAGQNLFSVILDSFNTIQENNKLNNTASFSFLISSNATKNLFPSPFAITNKQVADFMFQATDLLSDKRDFQFQLDTAITFNSSYLKTQAASGKLLVKLSFDLLNQDSTTYYWRTKLDKPKPTESTDWNTTSFTLIKGSLEGWGQLKFPQFLDNAVTGLLKDSQVRKLKYSETTIPVSVTTFGNVNTTPVTSVSMKINNVEYNVASEGQPCRNNTINLVAFNKNSAVPYAGIPFNFQDARTCGREPQLINSFLLSEMQTGLGDDLVTYVDNIQTSDSVVIFSIGNPGYSSWSTDLKNKLGELGISTGQLNALQDGEPLVIFGRKGASIGSAKLFKATNIPVNEQQLQVSKTISGRVSSGTIKSPVIGPSTKWISLVDQVTHVEPSDQFSYTIYGVSKTGIEILLQDNIKGNLDLSFIDASVYPYLKLGLQMQDPVNLTAIQLRKWLVSFEPAAEGLLIFKGSPAQQTLQEGQSLQSPYEFVNISNKKFSGQLKVTTDIVSKSSGARKQTIVMINPPNPGDTTKFNVVLDSKSKVGLNDVTVFVNPQVQPEQNYDNNAILLPDYLNVLKDKTSPVLEVRVDGRILANNDFVSSNPKIKILLHDENKFLLKTDTLGMTIFLKRECTQFTCVFNPIYFSRPDVSWTASAIEKDFQINFSPQNLLEGLYTLRIEGMDASGNKSGAKPYEISFQVSDTTLLTLRSVYPNPSSSSFYFSFVLQGNELPDEFSLQIISLNGKVVSNFDLNDALNFHIGTNELQWNGTDASGQFLPNGIYIYRLSISVSGQGSFQKGKLVIVK